MKNNEIEMTRELKPMAQFAFVTSNDEKISTARRHLHVVGLRFDTISVDLIEIQSADIVEIAKNKAEQAFKQLGAPVVVSDHSWSIPALNGFPGPFMKYVNQWFSTSDMQNLMAHHDDKTIIKTEVVFFRDSRVSKAFTCSMSGRFVEEPRGSGLPLMRIVSFLEDGRTVSECIESDTDASLDYTVWEDFAKWYLESKVAKD